MPFINGTFGSIDFIQHWQRDRFPVLNSYYEVLKPDFFGEQDMLTFVIIEVKKPNARTNTVASDIRKLPCMLKIALNLLLHANVDNPTVTGLLIHGKLQMKRILSCFPRVYYDILSFVRPCLRGPQYESEALYILKPLGHFKLLLDKLEISQLLPGLEPWTSARDLAAKTLETIIKRPQHGIGEHNPLMRPSYYVYGSKIPSKVN
ncbi:hypothetical protein BGZ49_006978 [Haplosporangium sp. Z 27]|nr:hypothetical protein BGZ49_006978 [Haplosporangium sp. Z 27]